MVAPRKLRSAVARSPLLPLTLPLTMVMLLPASGCVSPNHAISPGTHPLPVYDEAAGVPAMRNERGGPSLTRGHDRSHWEPVVVRVPINGVGSHEIYDWTVRLKDSTARQRGDFPTASTAIDPGSVTMTDAVEADLEIITGFGGIVLSAGRMITVAPPWSVRRSPHVPYERVPRVDPIDLGPWLHVEPAEAAADGSPDG